MKKVFLFLSISLFAMSCEKEEIKPSCNCGKILSDSASDYSITVKNSCSGNVKKFILAPSDWFNAHVGYTHCFTNVTSW